MKKCLTAFLCLYIFSTVAYDNTNKTEYLSEYWCSSSSVQAVSAPSNNAYGIIYQQLTSFSASISWTRGNGSHCAVFMKQTNFGEPFPVDNNTFIADTIFGLGSQIGLSGWFCIYNDTGSNVLVNGLSSNMPYRVMVCEYNGSPGNESYNTSTSSTNPITPPFTLLSGLSTTSVSIASACWFDLDNDGDLDAITTGSSSGSSTHLLINQGNYVFKDSIPPSLIQVSYGAVSPGDFNNDGWIDVIITGYLGPGNYQTKLYRNNNGILTEESMVFQGVAESDVIWTDFNLDGWQDIVLSGLSMSGAITNIYRNNGDNTFTLMTSGGIPPYFMVKTDNLDYNQDGYYDLIFRGRLNGSQNETVIYKNNRNNTFSKQTGIVFPNMDYGSTVCCGDANNDGYSDVFITGSPGFSRGYVNNQNNTFSNLYTSFTQLSNSCAAWGDFDNDGWQDIVQSGNVTEVYHNNSGSSFTKLNNIPLISSYMSDVACADIDQDNDLDIFILSTQGFKMMANNSNIPNAAPSAPTGLSAVNSGDSLLLTWNHASDDHTPQQTLSYNIYLGQGSNPRSIASPLSDLTNGYLRVPQNGNCGTLNWAKFKNLPEGMYYFGVQAIDQAFCGGPFYYADTFEVASLPSVAAYNIVIDTIGADFMRLHWNRGNGTRCLVLACEGDQLPPTPLENTSYYADSIFGNGDQIDTSGWVTVFNGNDSSLVLGGLTPNTPYKLLVYEYKGMNGNEKYNTGTSAQNPVIMGTVPVGLITPANIMACAGDSITLIVNTSGILPLHYQWYGPTTGTADTLPQLGIASVAFSDSGLYHCILINNYHSNPSDTVNMQIGSQPQFFVYSGDTSLCEGNSQLFYVGCNAHDFLQWYGPAGLLAAQTQSLLYIPFVTSADSGLYYCMAGNYCDTVSTPAIKLDVFPNPVVSLGNDTLICYGNSISLYAGSGFDSILWPNGTTTPWFTTDSAGMLAGEKTIIVRVSKNNCHAYDTISILFDPCTGVISYKESVKPEVYPNPAFGLLNIILYKPNEKAYVLFYDLTGRIIKISTLENQNNVLPIDHISPGVYILDIFDGNQHHFFRLSTL